MWLDKIKELKKEFKSYLLTPLGYIFIGTFLVMFSIFFVLNIGDLVNFENLFVKSLIMNIPLLLTVSFSISITNFHANIIYHISTKVYMIY